MEKKVYLIVEGLTDVKYLSQLLGPYLGSDHTLLLYPTNGFNYMLSSIRPVIDQAVPGSKILFVFDADTMNQQKAEERLDFVNEQIGYVRNGCKVKAFYFLPEIEEVILGEDIRSVSRSKNDIKEVLDYINTHRTRILQRKPLSDMIAFIEDKDEKQNPG